jgi:thioredoxin reductase (NADPH)
MSMTEQNIYDFLIIGAGCAGASAAMYAARLNLKTAMLGELPGGLITTTDIVENWPGIQKISGPDLAQSLLDHAMSYGVPLINERAVEILKAVPGDSDTQKSGFIVKTESATYLAKAVLIATGSEHRKLGVPGELEFASKGVSYCALCDAGFYRNKVAAVVGGGDSAAKEAILLAEKSSKVYVFVRKDVLRAEAPNQEKMKKLTEAGKLEIRFNTEIAEILGSGKVEKVKLKSGEEVALEGIFVSVGMIPRSDLAKNLGATLTAGGEIMIDRESRTNVPGVYAAGDVTDTKFKQAIIGAAEGITASVDAFEYVGKNNVVCY